MRLILSTKMDRYSFWILLVDTVLIFVIKDVSGQGGEFAALYSAQLGGSPQVVPPSLDVYQDELTVEAGQRLRIMCEGNHQLNWSHPQRTTQLPPLAGRLAVNETVLENSEGRTWHLSVLTVPSMQYADTGRFTCSYTDAGLNQPDTSVYVYVPDDTNLFLATPTGKFIWMSIYQGRPAVIPCLVTDPEAVVTFTKSGVVQEFGSDLRYDPSQGVTIVYPGPLMGGDYKCVAVRGNSTDIFNVLLQYRAGTIPPQPVLDINTGEDGNILVGEQLVIKCYVDVSRGTTTYIDFNFPLVSERVHIGLATSYPVEHNGNTYERNEKVITVSAIQYEDGGVYTCVAKNHDNKANSRMQAIYVHERAFIWLIPIESSVEAHVGAASVDLSITIEAYPDPELVWFKDGTPLSETDRRFEVKSRPDRSRLRIYNVNRGDTAVYTLNAVNRDVQTSEKITLTVLERPSVAVITPENHPFYIEHEFFVLTAHYDGSPTPTTDWEWQTCGSPGCEVDDSQWGRVSRSYNQPSIQKGNGLSTLSIQASETGFYRFLASNKLGDNGSEPIHLIVTDIAGGFGHYYADTEIQGQYLRPVVGDDVIVICKASPYAFMPPKMYRVVKEEEKQMRNESGSRILFEETSIAHILTLTLYSVDPQDEGWYMCKTMGFLGTEHSSEFHLETRAAKPPVFVKPLMGVIQLTAGVDHNIECDAKGDPTPLIVWTRDGVPLLKDDRPIMDNVVFNQNFTRLTFKEINLNNSGFYQCTATNRIGSVSSNVTLLVSTSSGITDGRTSLSGAHIGIIVGILFGIIILAVLLTVIFMRKQRKQKYIPVFLEEYLIPTATAKYNPDLPIDEQTECLAYDERWEIPKDKLKYDIVLGQGAFGKVMRADMTAANQSVPTQVAVKMVKDVGDREQLKALLSELKVLIHIGQHLNLVNLMGAVTRDLDKGYLYVIVEYCRYGNLRVYLTKKRSNFIDTMDDAVKQNALKALAKRLEAEELVIPPPDDEGFETSNEASAGVVRPKLNYPRNYRGPSINYPSMAVSTGDSDADVSSPTTVTYVPRSEYATGATGRSGISYSSRFSCDEEVPLTTKDLVCYAFQVARGMEYLTSRKYIHRDLAARNILLSDDNVVKICDFGLAKDCYKYDEYKKTSDAPVPIRWMAIESLTHKVYTTKSDVWSYGILLWEIFTTGGTPYPAMDMDETFINRLRQGYRLEKPRHASEDVYRIMRQCWEKDPDDRPSFEDLSEAFGNLLQESVKQFYMDLSTLYSEVEPGQNYVNMRGSEYLAMDTSDDDDMTASASLNPSAGNAYYLNQTPASDGAALLDASLEVVDEHSNNKPKAREDLKRNGSKSASGKSQTNGPTPQPRFSKIGSKALENGSGDHSGKSGESGFQSDYNSDNVVVPPRYSSLKEESDV